MADRKISELTNITGANLADDDEFALVDTSADETKAITFGEFKTALDTATGFVRITGDTMTGNLSMGDNVKAIFGAGSDLQIYHNGNNSYVQDVGTGKLHITSNGTGVSIDKGTSELMATFDTDGAVTLYYDNSAKIATTSTGISVTGNATFADNGKAIFGNSSDLQIYHDGSNSHIKDTATGNLNISGNDIQILNAASNEAMAYFAQDGDVTLYHNGAAKIATKSTGVDITGVLSSDGLTVENTGGSTLNINTNLVGADSKILLHEGSTASPANGASIRYAGATNEFSIGVGSSVDTKRLSIARDTGDISFYEDTGTTAKFFWDASAESLGIGTSSPTTKLQSKGGSISTPTNNAGLIANASASFVVDHGNDYGIYTGYVNSTNDAIGIAATRTLGSALPLSLQPFGGNVGIGTSSPAQILHLASSTPDIRIQDTDGGYADINVDGGSIELRSDQGNTQASSTIKMFVDGSERMRIDSSGNLLVGKTTQGLTNAGFEVAQSGQASITQSGASALRLNRLSSDGELLQFRKDGSTVGSIASVGGSDIKLTLSSDGDQYITGNAASNYMTFSAANAERMRIDASGNLLVGKTATTLNTTGLNVNGPDGRLEATASGNVSGIFNRTSSDGDIVDFRKDGSTVGSIGIQSTGFYIDGESGHAGIRFAGNEVSPRDNGSDADGVVSLGESDKRFKDLYLSGGVYLGGTGSANKLDDYEEGTFTGSLYGSTTDGTFSGTISGRYTKIGRLVEIDISGSACTLSGAAGNLRLTGLPFSSASGGRGGFMNSYWEGLTPTWTYTVDASSNNIGGYIIGSEIYFRAGLSASWDNYLKATSTFTGGGGSTYFQITGFYHV